MFNEPREATLDIAGVPYRLKVYSRPEVGIYVDIPSKTIDADTDASMQGFMDAIGEITEIEKQRSNTSSRNRI